MTRHETWGDWNLISLKHKLTASKTCNWLCHFSLRSYHKQHQTWGQEKFMQCLQRIREGTTTWRVWTCWPEADATWASVCNWTAVTPPCCWEQEQEELEMCQEGNVEVKTWDHLTSYGRGRESSFNSPTQQRTFTLYRLPTLKLFCCR